MLEPPRSVPSGWSPPRLFSKDDKRYLALIEVRRDLDEAIRAVEQFHDRWFVQDPPDKAGARASAAELRDAAQELRNAALNLLYLTSVTQE